MTTKSIMGKLTCLFLSLTLLGVVFNSVNIITSNMLNIGLDENHVDSYDYPKADDKEIQFIYEQLKSSLGNYGDGNSSIIDVTVDRGDSLTNPTYYFSIGSKNNKCWEYGDRFSYRTGFSFNGVMNKEGQFPSTICK